MSHRGTGAIDGTSVQIVQGTNPRGKSSLGPTTLTEQGLRKEDFIVRK